MCYSKSDGGLRCSSHARKRIIKLRESLNDLKSKNASAKEISKIEQEIKMAYLQYDSTVEGLDKLRAELKTSTGIAAEKLQKRLTYAEKIREESLAQYRIRLDEATSEHGDYKKNPFYLALQADLHERVNCDEFEALLADRDEKRNMKYELEAKLAKQKALTDVYADIIANKNPRKLSEDHTLVRTQFLLNEGYLEEDITLDKIENLSAEDMQDYVLQNMDEAYEKYDSINSESLDAYYAYNITNHTLSIYKDETALVVQQMNEIAGDPGTEYNAPTLGNAVVTASYDSGTREWLEERQKGIGGSDIGSILKLDPEFGDQNYKDFIKSKTDRYSEAEVELQSANNSQFSGATGRGNAWEPAIIRSFVEKNEDFEVFYTKDSYTHGENKHWKLNVDGLLSSDGGKTIDGILEIKTAAEVKKWFNDRGELVPPKGYLCQTAWYRKVIGNENIKYAYIAVMIDDREYMQYRVDFDDNDLFKEPDNPQTLDTLMPKIDKAWNEVTQRRAGTWKESNIDGDFFKSHEKDRIEGHANQLAALSFMSHAEAKRLLSDRDMAEFRKDYFLSAIPSNAPDNARFHFLDLETSGMGPHKGEIIEVGVHTTDKHGNVLKQLDKRYGLRDDRILDILGTGAEDVHKIKSSDIRGLSNFESEENIAELNEYMFGDDYDGNAVMIAHNKAFEERWLNTKLKGFRQKHSINSTARYNAEKENRPFKDMKIIDTMFMSRYLVNSEDNPAKVNNKLASFTAAHGVPYVDAHSALPDSVMTSDAFFKFWEMNAEYSDN